MDVANTLLKFRKKHKENLELTARVGLEPEMPFDQVKQLSFRVPRSVAPSGAVRMQLPSTAGFLVSTGISYEWDNSTAYTAVSGPFARTLLMMLPNGIVVAGSENIYRPWHTGVRTRFGAVIWPLEDTYDIPVLQQAGTTVNANFGSTATALSLPGYATTCAASGLDSNVATILSLSTTTVSPQGSWKTALGPVMNYPDNRRNEKYFWGGALSSGNYAMDSSPGSPFVHIPSTWTGGNTATFSPSSSFVFEVATIDRHSISPASVYTKQFLVPMGSPGIMQVSLDWSVLLDSTGLGSVQLHPEGVNVIFNVPYVNSGGGQASAVLGSNRIQQVSHICDRTEQYATRNTEFFEVPIPPFAVDCVIQMVWGNTPSLNISYAQLVTATLNINLTHETATLRPAFAAAGLTTNTTTTLTLNSALVTESTPATALLLGSCSVSPAAEELLVDIEGLLGGVFQRQMMLSMSTAPHPGPEIHPAEVTRQMEPIVKPTESGTFLFPLLSGLASAVLPKVMEVGKSILGGAARAAIDHTSDALQEARQRIPRQRRPTYEDEEDEDDDYYRPPPRPRRVRRPEARAIEDDTAVRVVPSKIVSQAVGSAKPTRAQKKKNKQSSHTAVVTAPYAGPLAVKEVTQYTLFGIGTLPPPGMITLPTSSARLEFESRGERYIFENFETIPAGTYSLIQSGGTWVLLGTSSTGIIRGSDLLKRLSMGGAAWGVGVTPDAGGSFWIIEIEPEASEFELRIGNDHTFTRKVQYVDRGALHVDDRLLQSFGDMAEPFLAAYSKELRTDMYINSVCNLDGATLHQAHGGSLLAPTLQAMVGFPLPARVLTGTPWDKGQPCVPDKLDLKRHVLQNAAQYGTGPLPCLPPNRLLAMVTDGKNTFPSLEQMKQVYVAAAA